MVKAGPLEKKQFFKGLSGRTTNKYFLGFLYLLGNSEGMREFKFG